MSAPINDGGPAFPCEVYLSPQDTMATKCPGMTLRDWFAGQALQGYLAGRNNSQRETPSRYEASRVACDCYAYADAMLAARLTKPE